MKILFSYPSESPRGDGRDYCRVLRRLGHDVRDVNVAASLRGLGMKGDSPCGYPAEITIEELFEELGTPDLFFYNEPFSLIPRGLERCPVPTVCTVGDPHRGVRGRRMYARLFDHVLVYQRNYVHRFDEHPPGAVHWLPFSCDTEVVRDLGLPRDIDVAQIGTISGWDRRQRRRIVSLLAQRYRINEQRPYSMEEIPGVYSRAKIVLDTPVAGDLNLRFFEALSCGSLLLTRRLDNGQADLLQENVHYVAYGDEKELLEKVDYYLRNVEERRRIALAGHAEALRRHNLEQRVKAVLESVMKGPAFGAPVRRMSRWGVLTTYASVYERCGRVDALLRMASERRRQAKREWCYLIFKAFMAFLRRTLFGW